MLSGEATNTNFIVFGLTRQGSNPRSTILETSTLIIMPRMQFEDQWKPRDYNGYFDMFYHFTESFMNFFQIKLFTSQVKTFFRFVCIKWWWEQLTHVIHKRYNFVTGWSEKMITIFNLFLSDYFCYPVHPFKYLIVLNVTTGPNVNRNIFYFSVHTHISDFVFVDFSAGNNIAILLDVENEA